MATSTDDSSEGELIAAAAAGNMGAFSELVREHRGRVLRTAYGILGSAQEAEDVAQDVFVKVWNSLPQYHGREGAFASWLYRISVNAAIDVLRQQHHEVSLDDERVESHEAPEEAVLQSFSRAQVREAVAALPPNARSVLILREYEQLSYREIAEALQVPIGTVMSRLNYARQSLKKKLAPGA